MEKCEINHAFLTLTYYSLEHVGDFESLWFWSFESISSPGNESHDIKGLCVYLSGFSFAFSMLRHTELFQDPKVPCSSLHTSCPFCVTCFCFIYSLANSDSCFGPGKPFLTPTLGKELRSSCTPSGWALNTLDCQGLSTRLGPILDYGKSHFSYLCLSVLICKVGPLGILIMGSMMISELMHVQH